MRVYNITTEHTGNLLAIFLCTLGQILQSAGIETFVMELIKTVILALVHFSQEAGHLFTNVLFGLCHL